jgi:hypothetical protein
LAESKQARHSARLFQWHMLRPRTGALHQTHAKRFSATPPNTPLKQGVNKTHSFGVVDGCETFRLNPKFFHQQEIALAWNGRAGTIDCNSTDI